jgi:hypothetical protein
MSAIRKLSTSSLGSGLRQNSANSSTTGGTSSRDEKFINAIKDKFKKHYSLLRSLTPSPLKNSNATTAIAQLTTVVKYLVAHLPKVDLQSTPMVNEETSMHSPDEYTVNPTPSIVISGRETYGAFAWVCNSIRRDDGVLVNA